MKKIVVEHGYDVLVGLASNRKVLPAEMERVVGPIRSGEADYVTGSRYLEGGMSPNLPAFRRLAIPIVNLAVHLATGSRVTDATCDYRAFRVDIFDRVRFDWRAQWLWTYAFEPYLYGKVLIARAAVRWLEVPITMRYPSLGHGLHEDPPRPRLVAHGLLFLPGADRAQAVCGGMVMRTTSPDSSWTSMD